MNGQLLKVYHPGLNRMVYVDSRSPRKMVTADRGGYLIRHTGPNRLQRRQEKRDAARRNKVLSNR